MISTNEFIFLLTGLIVGLFSSAACAYLYIRKVLGNAHDTNKLELEATRVRLQTELASARQTIEEQKKLGNSREVQIGQLNGQLFNLSEQKTTLEVKLRNEIENAGEKLSIINQAKESLTDTFASLSKQALDQNNSSFINQAEQVLKHYQQNAQIDLRQRQEKIAEIVTPVKESLEKVDLRIGQIEKERLDAYSTIKEQISQMATAQQKLNDNTAHLVGVLRNSKSRGQWGEIQLRRVVELAGMVNYCDFCEQAHIPTEEGRLRPDVIINLPSQRTIVIDAKAPMDAFLAAHEATDEDIKKSHFLRHAQSLRQRINQLGKKAYSESFKQSPEFVLLFLPNEAIYSVALEHDPELIEYGVGQNVIIATPSTLIALLKAAAYGWKQELIAKEVEQVSSLGKQLYERLSKMTEYTVKLGDSLNKTVVHYNSMVGSIETRVLTSARKFKDLNVTNESKGEIPALETIEIVSREFQSNELKPAMINARETSVLLVKPHQSAGNDLLEIV